MKIFEKDYDGESITDIERDIQEALDPRFSCACKAIPQDKWGMHEGRFTVSITWSPE